ncbi:hypothetical protein ACFQDE_19200 [Deinococcus caeni]|uniref:hypothetical protein n=1 Tax=Deinococcus caeni TaxID=569127 RepID=UPI0031EAD7CD
MNRLMVPIEVVGQLMDGPTLSVKTQNACPKSDFRAGVPTDFQLAESLVIFFGNLNAPMGTGHAQVYFFGALYLERELEIARQERDILKKALACLGQNSTRMGLGRFFAKQP